MEFESAESFFAGHFKQITNRAPYPWQKKLFLGFVGPTTDAWPEVVDLPTGAGKTSALYVWLLALAWSIQTKSFGVPRRLAWIVNRRVVVDQITEEINNLLARMDSEQHALRELLAKNSLTGVALAASTLRGEKADNGDWSRDPSAPAVIVGTVDMIGSRLLFRGYRAGRYFRPIHAGLLGVDTLIVNDEAHLSPALARLLISVRDLKPAGQIPGKSFRILLLSATPDPEPALLRFDHDPMEDAAESDNFSRIFHAPKSLTLREVSNLNELDAAIWSLATESPATRTAVFIEQPEKAAKLAERFRKRKRACALLTGTMRGFERDGLLKNATFQRFLKPESGDEPVWVVCTSAGEVGINFSCERMITGLTEADHLLQRFGRLNRFGSPSTGEAHVVFRKPSDKEVRLQATLAYLLELEGDVSCAKIWRNRPPDKARTEAPIRARLEDRHIDLWSQTTQPDRVMPSVASWLHGKQESEPPDAEVAWRSDVGYLTEWGIGPEQIREVLEYYPVQAREKLSEPASRVAKKLKDIADRIGSVESARKKLIVVESDGSPTVYDLAHLVKQTERDDGFLDYKMVLLSDKLGSVPEGMFHTEAPGEDAETLDVADPVTDSGEGGKFPTRVRFLCQGDSAVRLPTKESASSEASELRARETCRVPLEVRHPEEEDWLLRYYGARSTKMWGEPVNVYLSDHQKNVAAKAKLLANRSGLPELADTYEKTGEIHDSGKGRRVWQFAMRGTMEKPLAKTKRPVNPRLIEGYRHELGSLLDAVSGVVSGQVDDLLLHLVASHHAGARPFFEARQYDRENLSGSARESLEAARRYARLQGRYGAWGLAYLETVFKCADGIVSAEEGEAEGV